MAHFTLSSSLGRSIATVRRIGGVLLRPKQDARGNASVATTG